MAIPGILMQLAKNNPMMGQIKQMMNTVRMAKDPQAVLNQMVTNNPNMKRVMDVINQHGGNVEKAVYATAEQMGINPHDIVDMLK